MEIRQVSDADWPGVWEIFREVVQAGDTYPYAPDTDEAEAKRLWLDIPQATYAALLNDKVVGTYYLKPNQPPLGSHVCNAGYMVAGSARGQGVGQSMCEHSLEEARRLGFRAMQYNLVVAGNEGARRLWTRMGFDEIGVLPGAFNDASVGYVDAVVMYKELSEAETESQGNE